MAAHRLIPASAGNTAPAGSADACRSAHPRERGEHRQHRTRWSASDGSSPRARGTPGMQPFGFCHLRLIPASAGNTRSPFVMSRPYAAHPRERREHKQTDRAPACRSGSSPRARETLGRADPRPARSRLIPASAGNTVRADRFQAHAAAHPRERGEHFRLPTRSCAAAGSSPRAQGTPPHSNPAINAARLIPASAGNTCPCAARGYSPAAHPRERGEHESQRWCLTCVIGSSPRARGTRSGRHHEPIRPRLIPASAGNTRECSRAPRSATAHPRERGEHGTCPRAAANRSGSSPRARGTRRQREQDVRRLRLIPASAGNTTVPT